MKTHDTKQRLILAMVDALQRKGLHGVGLNELLERAEAPKGSLYHHFPGGKTELAVAAIEHISRKIDVFFVQLFNEQPDPLQAMERWLESMLEQLEHSRFERGCPLATIALESTPDDVEIRAALAQTFASLRTALAKQLHGLGFAAEQADSFASLYIALYEGGLLQARVAGSGEPLKQASQALFRLIHHYPRDTSHDHRTATDQA